MIFGFWVILVFSNNERTGESPNRLSRYEFARHRIKTKDLIEIGQRQKAEPALSRINLLSHSGQFHQNQKLNYIACKSDLS